jgi:phenylacetate-coenzyme A ligase PaaK-like adenylate-forming protein
MDTINKNLDEITLNQQKFKSEIFPIVDHPLYGTIKSFNEADCLDPVDLANFTNDYEFEGDVTNLEICPTCFFQTTGTTSRSKKIPYSEKDLDRQKVHEAISFKKLGMRPLDGVYSLGSPLPSISGWAIVNGSETVGANMLNTSQIDYETVFLRKQEEKANVLFGTPIVIREIGLAIEEEYGSLKKVFPNLRTAIVFGDVLPESFRKEIKELWGFENVYSLYGTVEADVVGTQCLATNGQIHLMSERLLFEIIPEDELAKEREIEGYKAIIYPIDEVPNNTIGEIIISDLSRDVLPLVRYRIGDIIQLSQNECKCHFKEPTISVLGRSKNTVLIDQHPLYEMQINSSLENILENNLVEWRLIEEPKNGFPFTLYLQVNSDEIDSSELIDKVFDSLSNLTGKLTLAILKHNININIINSIEQDPMKGDAKARRIILAE